MSVVDRVTLRLSRIWRWFFSSVKFIARIERHLEDIENLKLKSRKLRSAIDKNKQKISLSKENATTNALIYMANKYAGLSSANRPQSCLSQFEYKVFSQFGEDGVIAEIMSRIGAESHRIVEIGIGNGTECNSLNLLINFGWTGLLIEGNPSFADKANEMLAERRGISSDQLVLVSEFVDVENINSVISGAGFDGEVDVLSIDVDGNDIWLLKEINVINPRLIIVEYNASFGPDLSVSIPYVRDFVWARRDPEKQCYYGASVTALAKVARQKGYNLVYGTQAGVNLFFVRSDLMVANLTEITPQQAYRPNFTNLMKPQSANISALLEKFPYVEH